MSTLIETKQKKQNAILVMASFSKTDNVNEDLLELKNLAEANDICVVSQMCQNLAKPNGKTLIGEGKVLELKNEVEKYEADLIIFDNELSSKYIVNLKKQLGVNVIDRANLILDIFAKRAMSNEGKLQVELAKLKYFLPRITNTTTNKKNDRSGLRGLSESKTEINRRIVENNIFQKEKELKKLKAERDLRRIKRLNSNKKLVAIVGYTNSGKSTLLNTLTNSKVITKDMLFVTLDTTTRNLFLDENCSVMIVDTVGFVNKLPHELVEAFASTLEETTYADLLIHVVDASNSHKNHQEEVVLNVLKGLGVQNTQIITVYNKLDKLSLNEIEEDKFYISAKNGTNIEKLKNKIKDILF